MFNEYIYIINCRDILQSINRTKLLGMDFQLYLFISKTRVSLSASSGKLTIHEGNTWL